MALTIQPLMGQTLGQTRDNIRNNFQAIDTGFSVNHQAFNGGPNSGKHNLVTFPQQATAPVPATLTNEIQMFALADTKTPGGTGLFMLLANNPGPAVPFSITASALVANDGYTVWPSGIVVFFGNFIALHASTTVHPYINGVGIPTIAAQYYVSFTPTSGAINGPSPLILDSASTGPAAIGIRNSGAADLTVYYYVIGR